MSFSRKLFYYIYFFSLFSEALFIKYIFAIKLWIVLTLLYLIIKLKNFKIIYNKFDIFIMNFYGFYMITFFWASYPLSSLRLILGIIINLILYYTLKFILIKEIKLNFREIFVKSIFIFASFSLFLYIYGLYKIHFDFVTFNGSDVYGVTIDRLMPRLRGLTTDPNIYFFYSIFPFFYLLFLKNKSQLEKITLILLFITMLLTISRTGYLVLILSLLFFFLKIILGISFYLKMKKSYLFILITIILLGMILLIIFIDNDFINHIIERRVETASEGSGRFEIWKHGIELFYNNFCCGIGIYNFLDYNIRYWNDYHYMHNTFLQILVESGLIGFILYIFLLTYLFYEILFLVRKNKNNIYLIYIFLGYLVMMMSLSLMVNEVFTFFLAYLNSKIHLEKRKK